MNSVRPVQSVSVDLNFSQLMFRDPQVFLAIANAYVQGLRQASLQRHITIAELSQALSDNRLTVSNTVYILGSTTSLCYNDQ